MVMERGLLCWIVRMRAQAHGSGALLQRGAASPMREYAASAFTSTSDGFPHMELRDSMVGGEKRPVRQERSSRGYANSSVEKEEVAQVHEEPVEFTTRKTTATKRYAVGRTAMTDDEGVQGIKQEEDHEMKEKAKEILQQVGAKLGGTVEEAQIRQLQEKLAATEGIGDVVHELYNQQEEHHTDDSQTGAGTVKA